MLYYDARRPNPNMLRRTTMLVLVCGLLAVPGARAADEADNVYARSGWFFGAGFGVALEQFSKEYQKPQYLTTYGEGILSRKALGTGANPDDKLRIEPPFDAAFGTPDLIGINIDDRFAFSLHGGYRFHPHWAAEVQFEITDEFDVIVTENIPFRNALNEETYSPGDAEYDPSDPGKLKPTRTYVHESNANLKIRPIVATANIKGYVLTGRFQPYLTLGAGAAWTGTENRPDELNLTHLDFVMRFGGGVEFYVTDNILITCAVSYVYPMGFMQNKADYVSVEAMGFQYRFGGTD